LTGEVIAASDLGDGLHLRIDTGSGLSDIDLEVRRIAAIRKTTLPK